MAINLEQLNKQEESYTEEKVSPILEFLQRDISFSKGLPDKKKQWLFGELGLLLNAGVDIKNALDMIVEEQGKKKKDVLFYSNLREGVFKGESISDTLEKSKKFSDYDRFTIRIGEESGNLSAVLLQLSSYYEQKLKLRRQLTSAMSYPSLVIGAALAAILFLLNFLIPMFEDVFKRFSGELPLITQKIIGIADFFSEKYLFILGFIAGAIILYFVFRKTDNWRSVAAFFTLKMPLFGEIVRKNNLARFCQATGMLMRSKVPLTEALDLVGDMVKFYPLEKSLPKITKAIEHGSSLHSALKQYTLFDSRMVYLIRVAEEVNQLDEIFNQLHEQYSNDVEHNVSVMSTMLEPLLIIVVGLLVGVILIAMYLPLFQISNSFM
jgi:type IV pilus assembly protein PilC